MKVKNIFFNTVLFSVLASTAAAADRPIEEPSMVPPDAKPGQCFARIIVPAEYKEIKEKVLKKAETETVRIVPAQYQEVEEKVMVSEPYKKLEVVPAVYDTIEEKVIVKAESKKLEEVPAQMETVSEKVLEKPARTVWKKGTGSIQKVDNTTGDIMCLVEEPAVYKTITKQVVKAPATTREIIIPAEFKTIKKRVLKQPETVKEIEVPAEFTTVKVRKMIAAPKEERVAVPGEFEEVVRKEKISDQKVEWHSILCETNMTESTIKNVQAALDKAGFPVGTIDGTFGKGTKDALNAYQKSKGLPVDGYLNMDTIKSLGVEIKA